MILKAFVSNIRSLIQQVKNYRFIGRVRNESSAWWEDFVCNCPGELGFSLRERYLRSRLKAAGRNLRVCTGIRVTAYENISVGNNMIFLHNSCLDAYDGHIVIGDNVSINCNGNFSITHGRFRQ